MKRILVCLFLIMSMSAPIVNEAQSVTNADYTAIPPFIGVVNQPNVLVILDNSGSMNMGAYTGIYDPGQFSTDQYYGYFDPAKNYRYANTLWEVTTLPMASGTAANPIASGNFLNWATMRRVDIAKKLLTGGDATPRSVSPGQTVKLDGASPAAGDYSYSFNKTFDTTTIGDCTLTTPDPCPIYPFVENYKYTETGDKLSIDLVSGGGGTQTETVYPIGTIANGAWTIGGTAPPPTRHEAVDEAPNDDGNTTYIKNSTSNTDDQVVLDYKYTGASPGTITGVSVVVVAKKTGSSSQARRIQGVIRVNGVDYLESWQSLDTSYKTHTFTFATNPATGLPWLWTDIKSAGAEALQGFGVKAYTPPSSSNYPVVTQAYLVITYTTGLPASGGPYNIIVDTGGTDAKGIIDNLSSSTRFGLSFYNTDSQGAAIQEYVNFSTTSHLNNVAIKINGMSPKTMTPLAESLYNMTRYFKQEGPAATAPDTGTYFHTQDYSTGIQYDPYCFNCSGSNVTYVPCAKSFILFLTDGEPTSDTGNPSPPGDNFADVALWMRTQDLRPGACTTTPTAFNTCIPTDQRLFLYPVFLFGKGSTLLRDAAINGGFDDLNGNNAPDCTTQPNECYRDSDGDGVVESNGQDFPLTYFEGDDGYELQGSITNALADILKRGSSGTSVSILATSAEGEGALYQAYFYPEKILPDGTKRDWLGYCRGLFVDADGNLREDSDQNARLVYKKDNIVRMRLDTGTNLVYGDLYSDTTPEDGLADSATRDSTAYVDDLKALWEAGEKLALRDKWTRNIYTWVDLDNDGNVDNGDFSIGGGEASNLWDSWTLMPYLKADPLTGSFGPWFDALALSYYIQGYDMSSWGAPWPTSFRKRCIPITGATQELWGCAGATERVWTLGDIIYSTPTVVSGTREQYDQLYGADASTYTKFREKYNKRRHVVYVGANDGMLHAFNAGVYIAGDDTSTPDTEHGRFEANSSAGTNGFSNGWLWPVPAIGDELWSFVPYDNLPHLKWLASQSYSHVYYDDLKPKPTDVRIFCDGGGLPDTPGVGNCIDGQAGASHPGGWGTILIVGMRLGGGAMDVTADFDYNTGTPDTTRTFRSSYYALDITDPEKPPKLLWRFTDSNLGFTTSYPAIAHIKGSPEKWFMVVGSGPDNPTPAVGSRGYEGTSTQTARVFVVNILNGTLAKEFTTDSNAFIGDPTIVDGDMDFSTDVIYLGGSISTTGGKVYRINTNGNPDPTGTNWRLSTLIDTGRPLLVGPSVSKDSLNNFWVFFGTGRLFGIADKSNSDQQRLYGIKDACWKENSVLNPCNTSYSQLDLKNTSTLSVCSAAAGGGIYDSSTGTCGSGTVAYSSYTNLLSDMRTNYKGWYVNLTDPAGPSEKVLSRSVVLGGLVLFTTFTPSSDICGFQGDSSIYALYYETGTAYIKPVIGTTGSGATETVLKTKTLGKGMPTTVGIAVGKKTKGYVQTSTGTIVEVEAAPPLAIRSGAAGWREKTGGGGSVDIEEIYKHIVK